MSPTPPLPPVTRLDTLAGRAPIRALRDRGRKRRLGPVRKKTIRSIFPKIDGWRKIVLPAMTDCHHSLYQQSESEFFSVCSISSPPWYKPEFPGWESVGLRI